MAETVTPDELIARLRLIVGHRQLAVGDAVEPGYLDDLTHGPVTAPLGVIRPADTSEVSAILAACGRAGQAVVTQGGRTGLTRGGVAQPGELILSLERMNRIEHLDPAAGTMLVEAGAALAAAQDAADAADLFFPIDIGARGSCTIGGIVATNAGGNQVLRYGMTRDAVLGLEVVLADGTILPSLNTMIKNNAGFDLKQLFIGSEGTLGVVTRAVFRLRPKPAGSAVALCALSADAAMIPLLEHMSRGLGERLQAFEAMWADFFDSATAATGGPAPFAAAYPAYVLIEAAGAPTDALAALLSDAQDAGLIADAVLALSVREAARLWAIRDASGLVGSQMLPVEPFDISVPIGRIVAFVAEARRVLAAGLPGARALFFGHIADSNLHVIVGLPDEGCRAEAERLIYDLVRAVGGSVSAEHGIGMLKRDYLAHSRSESEIALMRRLRAMLDPTAILNPGRVTG